MRLLVSAASRHESAGQDELKDLLIEACVHTATADGHVDRVQIQLEHVARGRQREQNGRDSASDGSDLLRVPLSSGARPAAPT